MSYRKARRAGPARAVLVAALLLNLAAVGSAQQIEMFPPGPYVSHCRAPEVRINEGGDDDHNNVYYISVLPALADGSSAPDFYIHLWDGDNNSSGSMSGTQDLNLYGSGIRSPYEYRLYGGAGAADLDEAPPGENPPFWSGTLIDIDSDAGDDTLRTDDPDDIDDTAPEDLRDLDISLIGVDMDSDPGDFVGGLFVYKFVVDGTIGPGSDWNRYEIQATRDAGRTDTTGIRLFVFELTYAGRPETSAAFTGLSFMVPPTPTDEIDIQSLDLDCRDYAAVSQVTTPSIFYDDSLTYEGDEQIDSSDWRWTSLNQVAACRTADGITGLTYPTTGEEGGLWTLDIDPLSEHNPFSVRLADRDGALLPMYVDPVFQAYGDGPIALYGTGLPRVGASSATLEAALGPPGSPGMLLVSTAAAEYHLGGGLVLWVSIPWILTVSTWFDSSGEFSLPVAIPSGTPAAEVYLQTLGIAGPHSLLHSNGLWMTILPE